MPTQTKPRHNEALAAELQKPAYAKLSVTNRATALNAPQPTGATAMVMRAITVEQAAKQAKDFAEFAALLNTEVGASVPVNGPSIGATLGIGYIYPEFIERIYPEALVEAKA